MGKGSDAFRETIAIFPRVSIQKLHAGIHVFVGPVIDRVRKNQNFLDVLDSMETNKYVESMICVFRMVLLQSDETPFIKMNATKAMIGGL